MDDFLIKFSTEKMKIEGGIWDFVYCYTNNTFPLGMHMYLYGASKNKNLL